MKDIRDWWFAKRIEDLSQAELEQRIRTVMALDLKGKINTIPYVGTPETVRYSTDELIGLCPATGYPDIYRLDLEFTPRELLPELKSLKMYLMQYLTIPISHEHLLSKIYQDFSDVVQPDRLHAWLKVARRGGIDTTIEKY